MSALAPDNAIALSTAYDYRDEGIAILAARRPSLRGALLAAKAAGHSHVIVDSTLIHTDRISTPGPTDGVDLWWSGKHHHHGGNIQVVSAPGRMATMDLRRAARPGARHQRRTRRPDLLARIAEWVSDGAIALADLGYRGEPETFTIPFKKPKDGTFVGRSAGLQRPPRRPEMSR
ncbi:transposase family protein [Saccharopolyspora shandongensis]|uniref:transposase family protein n=1 Tax=Saccharopolyspora shandongensis TaxID=418495 RepID=UPI0033BFBD04